jgi:4-diphosphocytidyl-2-C-methyl-D-erythritol kinase
MAVLTLKALAPAKLNLFLHITGQRENGYHELQTVFQFLSYFDEITFSERMDKNIEVNGKIPGIADQQNLVFRAAKLIGEYAKPKRGIDIVLKKNIPIGGGLGGGSSDAATTLLALNQLWDIGMNETELLSLGLTLGADVPVFIKGEACIAEGIGEILTPITLFEPWFIVLIPPISVSTAEIFFHKDLTRNTKKAIITPSSVASFIRRGENDCQPVAVSLYPKIDEALSWLDKFSPARMTGTGSCVFAAFESESEAVSILKGAPFQGFVAQGLNYSPLKKSIFLLE